VHAFSTPNCRFELSDKGKTTHHPASGQRPNHQTTKTSFCELKATSITKQHPLATPLRPSSFPVATMDLLSFVGDVFAFLQSHPLLLVLALFIAFKKYQSTLPMPTVEGAKVTTVESMAEWNAVVKAGSVTCVDFYATWCPPCRTAAPIFAAMSKLPEYSSIKFVKVNVDVARDVAQANGISAMPTFKVFRGVEEVSAQRGWSETAVKGMLEPFKAAAVKSTWNESAAASATATAKSE
jgi:thioredoxin 1